MTGDAAAPGAPRRAALITPPAPTASPFLAACRGEPHSHTPVWFMRQAGRSLPEYRARRGPGSMLATLRQPDLATEITLQPVRRYGVDAAILYSDIMVPVEAIGFGVEIAAGVGPVVAEPFRSEHDLARLRPLEPDVDTPFVAETVRLLTGELAVPLIGFAGAPFTVASYLIEGRPSREHARTKAMMLGEPRLFGRLLDRLADLALASARAQVTAGAAAVQLFDSWVGALTPDHYRRHVMTHSAKVLEGLADLGVPRIHFGVGTGELLGLMAEAGADVVGVDWRVPLDAARTRVRPRHRPAGQPRPRRLPRPLAGRRGRGAGRPAAQRRPPRPRLQPGPRRAAVDRPRHAGAARRARARLASGVTRRPHVVVVGAGITGLAAAYELSTGGAEVEVVDAAARPGGAVLTTPFAGVDLDAGPDAFLARVPHAVELCRELGLGDELVAPATRHAYLWCDGRLRRFPDGLLLGIPTDLAALATSGIVSEAGVRRAAEDLERPADGPGARLRRVGGSAHPPPARPRGARPAGGSAPLGHLRRRHRPAQPAGRRAPDRGRGARRAEPAGRGPSRAGRRHGGHGTPFARAASSVLHRARWVEPPGGRPRRRRRPGPPPSRQPAAPARRRSARRAHGSTSRVRPARGRRSRSRRTA